MRQLLLVCTRFTFHHFVFCANYRLSHERAAHRLPKKAIKQNGTVDFVGRCRVDEHRWYDYYRIGWRHLMKMCLTTILFMFHSVAVFSQEIAGNSEYYSAKSKKQKTAASLMVGGGGGLVIIGAIIMLSESADVLLEGEEETFSFGGAMAVTGLATIVGSIPLFIASGKNKKKAAEVSFKMEQSTRASQQGFSINRYPAVSLRVCL